MMVQQDPAKRPKQAVKVYSLFYLLCSLLWALRQMPSSRRRVLQTRSQQSASSVSQASPRLLQHQVELQRSSKGWVAAPTALSLAICTSSSSGTSMLSR